MAVMVFQVDAEESIYLWDLVYDLGLLNFL